MARIVRRSSAVVSRRPASTHCCAASLHASRLKMNTIAGSIASASSRSTISTRRGVYSLPAHRPGRPGVRAAPRVEPGRFRVGPAVDEGWQEVQLIG